MSTRTRRGRLAAAASVVLALAVPLGAPAQGAAAAESLSVNLASVTGPATGVGEGFLYGVSQDGTQPADQNLVPLGITAFRGGGHVSGGWIGDGYQNGSGTQADVNTVIAQARRLTQPPNHAQYQVLLSDIFGADAGQPSNTVYPCTSGNCSNWVTFLDDVLGELQATGLKFAYDIWNEPELSIFWGPGVNTTQYFQMWDTAYREIRRVAPGATIVGPSFAFTPQRNNGEWQTWLAHVKSAGTVPDMITNHDEGDVDDPVTVAQAIDSDLAAAGLARIPLSANEYQPADRQTAGVTAWYLARFAQSGYTNAMRGNWVCCLTPNLTGVLTQANGSWQPNGNWWALRAYADMTGSLVSTSGQVGSTAISAAEDSSARRAVAIIGDSNGFTGAAPVTFSGLGSVSWLAGNGSVNVTVDRIPDQYPLSSPQVVLSQNMSTSGGSVTVPVTFQAAHDAFAIYLTPAGSSGGGFPGGYHQLVLASDALCLDVFGNTTASGAAIDQWTCNGQSNQQFQFVPVSGGYGELQAQNSGDDVTVSGSATASGVTDIVQAPPSGAASSLWLPAQQSDGSWQFKNQGSGLCLDVFGAGSNLGQQLDQWPCKNAPGTNQDFTPR
ncbi:MAG TPA: RICIN domain-containing protein [Streptosporangiaceae bacterium]|nr:RICIN domain-containing protein [Streptosporangiaceae bacterium]